LTTVISIPCLPSVPLLDLKPPAHILRNHLAPLTMFCLELIDYMHKKSALSPQKTLKNMGHNKSRRQLTVHHSILQINRTYLSLKLFFRSISDYLTWSHPSFITSFQLLPTDQLSISSRTKFVWDIKLQYEYFYSTPATRTK